MAQRLGVSTGTVSMALRDDARVSAKTRQKVQSLAQSLGYSRDAEISKLFTRLRQWKPHSYRENVCVFGPGARQDLKPHQRIILESFERRMLFLGYQIDYQTIPNSPGSGRHLATELLARGIGSCVILPNLLSRPELEHVFDWQQFKVVAFTPALLNAYDFVGYNWCRSLQLAVSQATREGAGKIGVIFGRVFHDLLSVVCLGIKGDLDVEGSQWRMVPQFEIKQTVQNKLSSPFPIPGLRAWFARERPDTLVITWEPWVASVLAELGLSTNNRPKIIVAGRGVISPFAGTVHDYQVVGKVGADMLDQKNREGKNALFSGLGVCFLLAPRFSGPSSSTKPQ
jgi:hypothetical protein